MDVNVIGGCSHYTTTEKKIGKSAETQNKLANQSAPNTTSVVAQISDEAKELYSQSNFTLQPLDENSPFFSKELVDFFSLSREERSEKLKSMLPKHEKPSLDPYIQYIFPEGSLGSFLTETLAEKVDNPSYVAKEIHNMIKGGIAIHPDATLEERAITREAGLKLAEYISQNYFDDPQEGKAFLDGVNMFAEKNILAEKGYIVFENSDMKPLKPYNTLSNTPAGYVSESAILHAYAKKYFGITGTDELLKNIKSVMDTYMNDMKSNPQKITSLKDEIVRDFAANEKNVQDTIDKAKNYFSGVNFDINFMNDMSDVLTDLNQSNVAKWITDILKWFH